MMLNQTQERESGYKKRKKEKMRKDHQEETWRSRRIITQHALSATKGSNLMKILSSFLLQWDPQKDYHGHKNHHNFKTMMISIIIIMTFFASLEEKASQWLQRKWQTWNFSWFMNWRLETIIFVSGEFYLLRVM